MRSKGMTSFLRLDGIVKKNLEYTWNKLNSIHVEDINLPDFKLLNLSASESTAVYEGNNFVTRKKILVSFHRFLYFQANTVD